MKENQLIRAVVVVAGKEPQVVEIANELKAYEEQIAINLTSEELERSQVNGIEFFSVGISDISGVVEEYSACHPYNRNRDWHGPAVFTQIGDVGQTISMDDEHIQMLMDKFALANKPKSKSQKINDFIEKHTPEPEIFNMSLGNHHGTLNTHDYINLILEEDDDDNIKNIEDTIDDIFETSSDTGLPVESVFNDFLKHLGKFSFTQMTLEHPLF